MLMDMAIKSTILLSFCAVAAAWLRTPAIRHAVWAAGIMGILAIAAMELLPGWRIVPVSSPPKKHASLDGAKVRIISPSGSEIAPAASPSPGASAPANDMPLQSPPVSAPTPLAGKSDASKPPIATASQPPAGDAHLFRGSWDWSVLLIRGWLAGIVLMILPLALAVLALRRVFRTARPVTSAQALAALAHAKTLAGVGGKVQLLESSCCAVPMTMGLLHPHIIVPAESAVWSPERWRFVLLHELAHAKRHDIAIVWMAQLARAIYWFHPLAWIAFCRLGIEAERTCDDIVLLAGTDASHYAAALVDIAEASQRRSVMAQTVLHMAGRSTLESRVRRVLDQKCRRGFARRAALPLVAAIALGAGTLGVLRAADSGSGTGGAREPAFYLVGDLPPDHNGTYTISGSDFRLLDAFKAAGLDAKFAGDKLIVLVRNGEKDHQMRQVITYADAAADPAKNVPVRENDMLIVERTNVPLIAADSNAVGGQFSLLGDVPMPGTYDMGGKKLSLMQALAIGRFDHDGLSTHRVELLRRRWDGKLIAMPVHIAAILAGTEPDRYLQDGDVINVAQEADAVKEFPPPGSTSAPATQGSAPAADHGNANAPDYAAYYVMGAVGHSGEFTLHGRMGVLQALAAAGAGEDLSMLSVTLIRRDKDGKETKQEIPMDHLLSDPASDVMLQGTDVLVVHHNLDRANRMLAEMEQRLENMKDALRLYTDTHNGSASADREADLEAARKSTQEFEDQVSKWDRE